ncbi:hypothetical protein LIER_12038 [Lithospermum erythrorhizon]|uniref:Uncharacterized protein n=1 Tax=Lithospermum erythrorhizon TaxID=34254 RepID=A0AAV3PVG5_LITER
MVASIETPTPNNTEYEGGRYDDEGSLHVETVDVCKGISRRLEGSEFFRGCNISIQSIVDSSIYEMTDFFGNVHTPDLFIFERVSCTGPASVLLSDSRVLISLYAHLTVKRVFVCPFQTGKSSTSKLFRGICRMASLSTGSLTDGRLFQVKLGENPNFAEKKSP